MNLNKGIAQSIVSRTMNLIQYNINIMNERGVIIGSGDPSRVGDYHQGAFRVLEENIVVEVRKGSIDFHKVAKEGVNLPIRFNEKPVGVVGITGDPDEVRIHGAMVQAMAELMLEEAFYWEQESMAEQAKLSLINDLIYGAPGLKQDILITRASMLGYKLNLPRVVVVFELNKEYIENGKTVGTEQNTISNEKIRRVNKQIEELLMLSKEDLFAAGIGGRYILIKHFENQDPEVIKNMLISQFNKLETIQFRVSAGIGGVSSSYEKLNISFSQALQALEVGKRLYGNYEVVSTEDLGLEKFVELAGKEFRRSFSSKVLAGLKVSGKNLDQPLLETAIAFINNDMKSGETSQLLFIHRNTLTYRLDKIKAITGLNLKKLDDALKFKMALMCFDFDQPYL